MVSGAAVQNLGKDANFGEELLFEQTSHSSNWTVHLQNRGVLVSNWGV